MTSDREWAARVIGRAVFVIAALADQNAAKEQLLQELRDVQRLIEAEPPPVALEPCPECHGLGEVYAHLCGEPAGWNWTLCTLCGGDGFLNWELAQRVRRGQILRESRRRRCLTLREEAARLGMSEAELSQEEWGRR